MSALILGAMFALSIGGSSLGAEFSEEQSWTHEDEHLETFEEGNDKRITGWNQWICAAYAPYYFQPFVGWSYYFRAGSGEGQQARSLAYLTAIQTCEFRTGIRCQSRLERDCEVRRY
ncbi:MAG: hypothetical protein ACOH5I_15755 [Oligoflexus sp.]